MRSKNLARAVLRSAGCNSPAAQRMLARSPRPVISSVPSVASAPLVRAFSSSCVDLKKKAKKNAFASTTNDDLAFSEQGTEEAEFAIKEDDDLFGSISDSNSTAAASSSTSASTSVASGMSRIEFAQALETYRHALEWENIDRGRFPSLHKWRNLAGLATTKNELERVLKLAKLYRDRVGSLGVESGWVFAGRANKVGLPEVALNAFLDRYTFGLEYNMDCLYLIQAGLARKLKGDEKEIRKSAKLPGAPVQHKGFLRFVRATNKRGKAAKKQVKKGVSSEANEVKHGVNLPLARAQLSIIDRMALVATLSTIFTSSSSASTSPIGAAHDPVLLSYITDAYIATFELASKTKTAGSQPWLANLYTRTDALTSLLTLCARRVISAKPSSLSNVPIVLPPKRSAKLVANLITTLTYVATRRPAKFKSPVDGSQLDPVKTLYRYMDLVGPKNSNVLVTMVEPLLQRYSI